MPTTSPRLFTKGPPLFPEAMAAVWIMFRLPCFSTMALTVPSV